MLCGWTRTGVLTCRLSARSRPSRSGRCLASGSLCYRTFLDRDRQLAINPLERHAHDRDARDVRCESRSHAIRWGVDRSWRRSTGVVHLGFHSSRYPGQSESSVDVDRPAGRADETIRVDAVRRGESLLSISEKAMAAHVVCAQSARTLPVRGGTLASSQGGACVGVTTARATL
jgi:hypothetical protein